MPGARPCAVRAPVRAFHQRAAANEGQTPPAAPSTSSAPRGKRQGCAPPRGGRRNPGSAGNGFAEGPPAPHARRGSRLSSTSSMRIATPMPRLIRFSTSLARLVTARGLRCRRVNSAVADGQTRSAPPAAARHATVSTSVHCRSHCEVDPSRSARRPLAAGGLRRSMAGSWRTSLRAQRLGAAPRDKRPRFADTARGTGAEPRDAGGAIRRGGGRVRRGRALGRRGRR